MNNKLLKTSISIAALLFSLSVNAAMVHVTNNESVDVEITIKPDNGGSIAPEDTKKEVVKAGEHKKIHVDHKKFGKHFSLSGAVGMVSLDHDKLSTHHDYKVTYSRSENGGAIDNFAEMKK